MPGEEGGGKAVFFFSPPHISSSLPLAEDCDRALLCRWSNAGVFNYLGFLNGAT